MNARGRTAEGSPKNPKGPKNPGLMKSAGPDSSVHRGSARQAQGLRPRIADRTRSMIRLHRRTWQCFESRTLIRAGQWPSRATDGKSWLLRL
jgi:hypothetical protein